MNQAEGRADAEVHQMLWKSSQHNLSGYPGFGPVASSLPEHELSRWWMALRTRLNAAEGDPSRSEVAPGDDFGFLQVQAGDRDYAVVIRKRSVPDDLGRPYSTRAHVLIGPPADAGGPDGISVEVALGLTACDWEPWLDAGEATENVHLPALRLERVRMVGLQALQTVRNQAHSWQDPQPFADLLLRVLSAPQAASVGLSSTASLPAEVSPVTLICALADVLGSAIEAPWTFATREPPAGWDSAWLVFTDGAVAHSRASSASDPWLVGLATLLARRYREEGLRGVEPFIPRASIKSVQDAVSWAHSHQLEPGIPRERMTLLSHAWEGKLTETERDYIRRAEAGQQLREMIGTLSQSELATLLDKSDRVIPASHSITRDEAHIASLVLADSVARWSENKAGPPLDEALRRLAMRAPADVRGALLAWFTARAERLRPAEPGEPVRPAGRQLIEKAVGFDRLVPDATAAALEHVPADVLLGFISDVSRYQYAADPAVVRLAWRSVRLRTVAEPESTRIRQVIQRPAFLHSLEACVDVLAGGDGRPGPWTRLAERVRIYQDMLLNSPTTGWVFLDARKKLLMELLDMPGLDNALILAVWEWPGLSRKTRTGLTLELARRYQRDLINSAKRS